MLDIEDFSLLTHRAWLGEAELQQQVEVVEGAVVPDEVPEVKLWVLSLLYLGLAEDADNPIRRVVWPVSIHDEKCVLLIMFYN